MLFSDITERFTNRRPVFVPFQVNGRVRAFRCISAHRAVQEMLVRFSCKSAPFPAQSIEGAVSSSRS